MKKATWLAALALSVSTSAWSSNFDYLVEAQPEFSIELPRLNSVVQYENEYCTYQDKIPFVKEVKWDHPTIQAALKALLPGFRSTFSYGQWKKVYDLEKSSPSRNDAEPSEELSAYYQRATARNFIKVLCGEFRDYPAMIDKKLEVIINATNYAGPNEMTEVDTDENLFTQMTYPAYEKMVHVMEEVHAYRQAKIRGAKDGYDYAQGRRHAYSRRVDNSVAPHTHCEMKFMFSTYMVEDAPAFSASRYVREYEQYKETCSEEDFEYMYNFRGHKNYKPLWLESNGFMWNSLRAESAERETYRPLKNLDKKMARYNDKIEELRAEGKSTSYYERKLAQAKAESEGLMDEIRKNGSYYLRPFAERYTRSRMLLGTYLFYANEHEQKFSEASNRGGGFLLYVTDEDANQDGIADYKLFNQRGGGDLGVGSSSNANKVSNEVADATENTTQAAEGYSLDSFWKADMGFMEIFQGSNEQETFANRMARFNNALDRHTNWGPTSYYNSSMDRPYFRPSYSPIVACSYDISASHEFAVGDYPTTHDYEKGNVKWFFIMKFKTSDYYDEKAMKEGKAFDFDTAYFNETSLSNDYYRERALDRFGWIPAEDIHANVYFVYGNAGDEAPEAPESVPSPEADEMPAE